MLPFIILGLPRSRTAWLSRFLTYGDHICGHDELRHMRSLDDVRAWFAQPNIGTAETSAAPWWRLLGSVAPQALVVVVRRPVRDVVESLLRLPGLVFDRTRLEAEMLRLDHKLDQIAARYPGVLSVQFDDLAAKATCQAVFEHCLPYEFDPAHWAALAETNVQCDMRAMTRYIHAYMPALEKLASLAKHKTLTAMAMKTPTEADGVTFQTEGFDTWLNDAHSLFERHCAQVGEAPENWHNKNEPLYRVIADNGMLQITTARSNGRMFGYLVTLVGPSLFCRKTVVATHTLFFADPDFPGLGMKIQRAAMDELLRRGVTEVAWEANNRSDPRLGTIYRRLGGVEQGKTYRMTIPEIA